MGLQLANGKMDLYWEIILLPTSSLVIFMILGFIINLWICLKSNQFIILTYAHTHTFLMGEYAYYVPMVIIKNLKLFI